MTDSKQRKSSITTLIQSTFAPSLSLVPEGQGGATTGLTEGKTTTNAELVGGGQRNRPLDSESHSGSTPTSVNGRASRERVSLKGLHFNAKSSAGIGSSSEQASLTKQDSVSSASGMASPSSSTIVPQNSRTSMNSSDIG